LVFTVPRDWRVAALGLGNTIGMSVAGVLLLAALVRTRGRASVHGLARAAGAGWPEPSGAVSRATVSPGASARAASLMNVGVALVAAVVAGGSSW